MSDKIVVGAVFLFWAVIVYFVLTVDGEIAPSAGWVS